MRLALSLRWPLALSILAMSACVAPPSIPAPWEATEPQSAEPSTALPDVPATTDWTRIGTSVRGKAILATTVGSGPRRIYIIGGIHGDDPECPAVADKLPELLGETPGLEHSTVRVVRDMNPDGTSAKMRTNTRKVDLERNWPSKDYQKNVNGSGDRAGSELETAAVYADAVAFKPDIVIVFQSANLSPTVTYLGSGRMLAYEFASSARRTDPLWRFNPEPRMRPQGSIESLFGTDLGKTVMRVEFQKKQTADVNALAALAGLKGLDGHPLAADATALGAVKAPPARK